MKELSIYKKMNAHGKVAVLTREYMVKYPTDSDLKQSYVTIMLQQAKANMLDGRVSVAISDWKEIIQHGDSETSKIAQHGLYHAYVTEQNYPNAIMLLDEMLSNNPKDADLTLKKQICIINRDAIKMHLGYMNKSLDGLYQRIENGLLEVMGI